MKYLFRILIFSTTVVIVTAGILFTNGPAWSQTDVEKLYADLSKLTAAEREKRIVEGARKEGTLRVIKTIRGKLGRGHLNLFTKRYPWLKVEHSEMGSQDAAERLVAEETAGRHLTDVIGMSVLDLAVIMEKDLSAVYPTSASEKILKKYQKFCDSQKRWTIWYWSEHGIVYNTKLLKPEDVPKSWDDLCDPKFKGKASYEPLEVRYLVNVYDMMGEEKFKKWLECVGKNDPIIQRGHTTRLQLMLAGDHSLSGDQYFYNGMKMKSKNPKTPFGVNWSIPILTTGGCNIINKNTPYPYAAALYVDWCLTDESQKYMASEYRGPVTIKHPYMPDDVELVGLTKPPSLELVEKVSEYWKTYIGGKSF